jgi:hypothetical protein
MGRNDHIDFELHDQIEDLVDEGIIEKGSTPYGVAQQVINEGYKSLSPKQRWVYDTVIGPALAERGEELEMIRIINSNPD